MRRAIREHLRDAIAIVALLAAGLVATGVILSQQQAPYPAWVPFLGEDTFKLRGAFGTAQAVTPGQGQPVIIAGIRAGDVTAVELSDGRAVVTMEVEERYAPLIRDDATLLLRPRTGLQDMTIELDLGTSGAPIAEGATVPLSQTASNVMPDRILASLDADTRDYLRLLLGDGAEGIGDRGTELSAGLRRFEPLARDLGRVNGALAERRERIRAAITSFREVSEELGAADTRLAELVASSNEVIGSFASQEASLREALGELPGTLGETRRALEESDRLAAVLGPTSRELIPAARALAPAQRSLQELTRLTVSPIASQIRPFARRTQPVVGQVKRAAGPLGATTERLAGSLGDLVRLFNALGYDPPGPGQSHLFWLAWLNHNANSTFLSQDAHGPLRRGLVLQSCATARLAEGLSETRPFLRTLQELTRVAHSQVICPLDPP